MNTKVNPWSALVMGLSVAGIIISREMCLHLLDTVASVVLVGISLFVIRGDWISRYLTPLLLVLLGWPFLAAYLAVRPTAW